MKEPQLPPSIFFGKDRGMVFFVAFLSLTTFVLPTVPLSQLGRLAVSLSFALTLVFGAFATIHHRIVICLVIGLTLTALLVDQIVEFGQVAGLAPLNTALKLVCLSILVLVTVERAFRPGRVTGYRVIGGIAGYLLIGYTWAYAYQLLLQHVPDAIQFGRGMADSLPVQPKHLIYFSFTTLTTVGYGDVAPAHPIARSLAVAEALVGQLYLAILIATLVGMALQAAVIREGDKP
jgi:Ion channel